MYSPDSPIAIDPSSKTALLAQRDASIAVPINYVTHSGVSLTSVCFGENLYLSQLAERCISNLLALRIRRIHLDLFWDDGLQDWSLCPLKFPSVSVSVTNSSVTTSSRTSSLTSASTQSRSNSLSLSSAAPVAQRQALNDTVNIGSPTTTNSNGTYSSGSITCSPSLDVSFVSNIFADYSQKTGTTLDARLTYLILNLASASNSSDSISRPPRPTTLPSSSNGKLLGPLLSANASAYLYKPSDLSRERRNLNASWYTVSESYRPILAYLNTSSSGMGILSSVDGWPSEGFVELTANKRALIGYGAVDPSISQYNMTQDADIIFAPGTLFKDTSAAGNDCLEKPTGKVSNDTSWANFAANLSSELTSLHYCGVSPFINTSSPSAASDLSPYISLTNSEIWAWAANQPSNTTISLTLNSTGSTSNPSTGSRCAKLDSADLYSRWTVADCKSPSYGACRRSNTIDTWHFSSRTAEYQYLPALCPDNSSFAAPRTALEQAYLSRAYRNADRTISESGVFVNINSQDIEGCWVTSGPDGTCPYSSGPSDEGMQQTTVLVPTIAALIVLCLTILFLIAKCNQNRKGSKKRKRLRLKGEWEYEGVPS